MRKTISVAVAAVMVGCAPMPPMDSVEAQCQYEAEAATPMTRSMIMDAYRIAQLKQSCLRARGR